MKEETRNCFEKSQRIPNLRQKFLKSFVNIAAKFKNVKKRFAQVDLGHGAANVTTVFGSFWT